MNLTNRIKRQKHDTTTSITASANTLMPYCVYVPNGVMGKTLKISLVADLGRPCFIFFFPEWHHRAYNVL